jgi:hypothetical protein
MTSNPPCCAERGPSRATKTNVLINRSMPQLKASNSMAATSMVALQPDNIAALRSVSPAN